MTVGATTDAVLAATDLVKWDISLDEEGDILTADFFDTALLMSIFCERRATASEVPNQRDRRGWIGNESFTEGFEIGSKIWLFSQARLTQDTLNGITSAAQEAFQWLIDGDFVENITATTSFVEGLATLDIEIFRANSPVDRRLFSLWDASGVTTNTGF